MAYDIVIKNGTMVDGTGRHPYRADVAIQGEPIAGKRKNHPRSGNGRSMLKAYRHSRVSLIFTPISTRRSFGIHRLIVCARHA